MTNINIPNMGSNESVQDILSMTEQIVRSTEESDFPKLAQELSELQMKVNTVGESTAELTEIIQEAHEAILRHDTDPNWSSKVAGAMSRVNEYISKMENKEAA